jgi:hypothetical protein
MSEVWWGGATHQTPLQYAPISEKLIVPQLPKNPRTRRFIIVFTTARNLSKSQARWIHPTPSHPSSVKIHFNIITRSTHMCILNDLSPHTCPPKLQHIPITRPTDFILTAFFPVSLNTINHSLPHCAICSSPSSHFLPLPSKYLPQHPLSLHVFRFRKT